MKVTPLDGGGFRLECENAADEAFTGALYHVRFVEYLRPVSRPATGGGWDVCGAELLVSHTAPQKLVADAGRQAVRCIRDLFSLGSCESALAADSEELQRVAHALRDAVLQLEAVLKKVRSAHQVSPVATPGSMP